MTSRIWKAKYLKTEVYPALEAAGYVVHRDPDSNGRAVVYDPKTEIIHLKALPRDAKGRNLIVRFNPMLFDDTAENQPLGTFCHA